MPRRTHYLAGAPCWIDRVTADLTAAQQWYAALFGWEYTQESGNITARLDGEIVAGFGAAPTPIEAWMVYLATKDLGATMAGTEQMGGRVTMAPVAVGEFGRLALAIDPVGAAVGFWEGHRPEGVVLAGEPGSACRYELRVGDAGVAGQFYGTLFGSDVSALVVEDESARPAWVVYFGTADLAGTVLRALSAGARITRQNADGSVVLRDSRGAVFGLTVA
jgi:predicted enzyme related to lactoylglutathione lyase